MLLTHHQHQSSSALDRRYSSAMLYRIVRTINEWYALTLFWTFLGLFFVAFALVFVFPPGTIVLLFLGLGAMGVAVVCGRILRGTQRSLARRALSQGRCPRCLTAAPGQVASRQSWKCEHCGTSFGDRGDEAIPTPAD